MGALPNMFSSTSGQNWTASGAPSTDAMNNAQNNVSAALGVSQNQAQQQQAFLNAIGNQGLNNQKSVFGQQQGLADQLQAVANGNGPNTAGAMLQQSTNQNIAQAAGTVANTKGINPALAARLAGQQAGQMQQTSANQAAMLKAQQQLGAMSQLGQQQNSMANLAGNQVGQQMGMTNSLGQGYNQAAQGNQGQLMGMQANVNQANAGIQAQTASAQGKAVNDLFGGAMSGAGSAMMAHGGQAGIAQGGQAGIAQGGQTPEFASMGLNPGEVGDSHGPKSNVGKMLSGMGRSQGNSTGPNQDGLYEGTKDFTSGLIKAFGGGSHSTSENTAALTAAANQPMKTNQADGDMPVGGVMMAAYGGKAPKNMKGGGPVPGKAKFKGDTLKNDTVPAMLSPGEMVVPRTIAQSGDPDKAKAFIAALMAKNGRMK